MLTSKIQSIKFNISKSFGGRVERQETNAQLSIQRRSKSFYTLRITAPIRYPRSRGMYRLSHLNISIRLREPNALAEVYFDLLCARTILYNDLCHFLLLFLFLFFTIAPLEQKYQAPSRLNLLGYPQLRTACAWVINNFIFVRNYRFLRKYF